MSERCSFLQDSPAHLLEVPSLCGFRLACSSFISTLKSHGRIIGSFLCFRGPFFDRSLCSGRQVLLFVHFVHEIKSVSGFNCLTQGKNFSSLPLYRRFSVSALGHGTVFGHSRSTVRDTSPPHHCPLPSSLLSGLVSYGLCHLPLREGQTKSSAAEGALQNIVLYICLYCKGARLSDTPWISSTRQSSPPIVSRRLTRSHFTETLGSRSEGE